MSLREEPSCLVPVVPQCDVFTQPARFTQEPRESMHLDSIEHLELGVYVFFLFLLFFFCWGGGGF